MRRITVLLGAAFIAFGLGIAVGHQWHQRTSHHTKAPQ